MKLFSKDNLKTKVIVISIIYLIIMYSFENYVLTTLLGDLYTDNFVIYHNAYELFVWLIPIQLFIFYVSKRIKPKKIKLQLALVSLGLWLFLLGFTFL